MRTTGTASTSGTTMGTSTDTVSPFSSWLVRAVFDNIFSRPALWQRFPQLFDRNVVGCGQRTRTQGRQSPSSAGLRQGCTCAFSYGKTSLAIGPDSIIALSVYYDKARRQSVHGAKDFFRSFSIQKRPAVRSGCRAVWFPKGKVYFLVRYLRMSMAQAIRMTRPLMM